MKIKMALPQKGSAIFYVLDTFEKYARLYATALSSGLNTAAISL